ncbi:MAG: hypothetical protein LBD20_00200 [Spirochaetaceae bacterium]|jgi:hypothetical protein|nr:hypothetical protein [Spirochaetaceae bacterium]
MHIIGKAFSAAFGRRMQRAAGFLGAVLLCVLLVTAAAGCRSGDSDTAGQSLPGGKTGTDPGGGTGDVTDGGSTGPTYDGTFVIRVQQDWDNAITAINAGGSDKSYEIQIAQDVTLSGSTGPTFDADDLSVIISGEKTVTLTGQGSLVNAKDTQDITLEDVTFVGVNDNNTSLVRADGGTIEMQGNAAITGNSTTTAGGGVIVENGGTLIMGDSASVTGNKASGAVAVYGGETVGGGGVLLNGGTVEMSGNASITGNEATGFNNGTCGGGAGVMYGTFTMSGDAVISGNIGDDDGGGVCVKQGGIFVMKERSKVYGNTARNAGGGPSGGGIFVADNAVVKMMDESSVYANTAYGRGGGVDVDSGTFQMGGGVVYGSEAAEDKRNSASLGGAAFGLYRYGAIKRGTFDAEGNFTELGSLLQSDTTIRVNPLTGALE